MNDAHGDLRPEGDPTDASDPRTTRPPTGGSSTPSAPPGTPASTLTRDIAQGGGAASGPGSTNGAGGTGTASKVPSGQAGAVSTLTGNGNPDLRNGGGAIATAARPGEAPAKGSAEQATVPPARVGESEGGPLPPGVPAGTPPPGFGAGPKEPRTFQGPPGQEARQPARATGRAGYANARQERREQTRTALLSAAERLWAERGIHGASLDDIAAAAGLTKGAVYSNFAGKTDLLLALLERFTSDRLGTDVCDELRSADHGRSNAERSGRNASRDGSDDRARRLALLLVEFWLYGMRDYAAGWRIADWYAERRAHMASELRDVDGIAPTERAALAMALDFGLAFQHLLDPERVPADLYSTGIDLMLGRAAS
ncbi:TetR/AcrR family transcriptional regulator [Actinomadura verrucosospora]|uniref:HTH tetR-type domain-containing protein n=1 Tax=Actinomadura verrucosospora TaxID=46165 RepID=A0A7D3W2S1_ACTVE|nr:TetR/AcrR family transcriptional regulator [Actinomadura verrucosospora]QKG24912.1 hypothetical protein ACTIVE_6563 [Actinomadura verrucosospora]